MADNKKDFDRKIIFFDGLCHLCNGFVDFVIQNETDSKSLIFAPLQGTTASVYLSESERARLESVLFWKQGKLYQESEAVAQILICMGGIWKVLGRLLWLVPGFLRNPIYRWVAKNRYRWFGTRESCRLPLPQERDQLWP